LAHEQFGIVVAAAVPRNDFHLRMILQPSGQASADRSGTARSSSLPTARASLAKPPLVSTDETRKHLRGAWQKGDLLAVLGSSGDNRSMGIGTQLEQVSIGCS
jgi:hypothetical protein